MDELVLSGEVESGIPVVSLCDTLPREEVGPCSALHRELLLSTRSGLQVRFVSESQSVGTIPGTKGVTDCPRILEESESPGDVSHLCRCPVVSHCTLLPTPKFWGPATVRGLVTV